MNVPAQQQKIKTIRDLFERAKPQIALAVPKHLTPERIMRVAMTAIQRTPKLLDCDAQSLLASVMQCAQLGLEPDGILGHAYLVPFKNNKRGGILEAQFMIGYKGLISLARRSGEVSSINAQVVYSNDEFDYSYGLDEKLFHRPTTGERGRPIAAYCVARFKDGGHAFEVMTYEDIESIRKRSKAAEDGPWVTDWPEMARKTVVRKLAKYLPLSIEFQKAAALDEYADAGLSTYEEGDMATINGTATQTTQHLLKDPTSNANAKLFDEHDTIKALDSEMLGKYVIEVAKGNNCSINEVKTHALGDITSFTRGFAKWWAGKTGQPTKEKKKEKTEATPTLDESNFNPVDVLDDFISLPDEEMAVALQEKITKKGYADSFIKKPLDSISREEKVSLWNLIEKMSVNL